MNSTTVIAALRSADDLEYALASKVSNIFMLSCNISEIGEQIRRAHENGKKLFVHLDLAEGIGKDEYGIRFLKECGVDGIISTRTGLIKLAKKVGVFTVQRFFIVDSQSVQTTLESLKSSHADMIEIMPGTVIKVIKRLKRELGMPIVAGGLIESLSEINDALESGASAVSTGKKEFW